MSTTRSGVITTQVDSNGGQFGDWTNSNCNRCTKGAHRLGPDALPDCALELALVEAYLGDGNITDAIAERLGCNPTRYCWKCAEWEPTEAWKNIFRALDAFVDAIVLDNEEAVEQCDQ